MGFLKTSVAGIMSFLDLLGAGKEIEQRGRVGVLFEGPEQAHSTPVQIAEEDMEVVEICTSPVPVPVPVPVSKPESGSVLVLDEWGDFGDDQVNALMSMVKNHQKPDVGENLNKTCLKCLKEYPCTSEFFSISSKGFMQDYCQDCMREYQLSWKNAVRDVVNTHKKPKSERKQKQKQKQGLAKKIPVDQMDRSIFESKVSMSMAEFNQVREVSVQAQDQIQKPHKVLDQRPGLVIRRKGQKQDQDQDQKPKVSVSKIPLHPSLYSIV